MGELLTFTPPSRLESRTERPARIGATAEIVIFPGIRIERHETGCARADGRTPRPTGGSSGGQRRRPAR